MYFTLQTLKHKNTSNPLKTLTLLQQSKTLNDPHVYASLIKSLTKQSFIKQSKSVHCHVIKNGFDSNLNVSNTLLNFYMALQGKFVGCARKMFDKMLKRDANVNVVSVNCMVKGYVRNGMFDEGLRLFRWVLSGGIFGITVNYVTLVVLVSGCVQFKRVKVGKGIHSYCCKTGFGSVNEVGNALIDMYGKFECMRDAERLFEELEMRDIVSWNTVIGGYVRGNECRKAVCLFQEMRASDVGFDRVSLVTLVLAAVKSGDSGLGKLVHGFVKTSGAGVDLSIGTALIDMYAKCGVIELAQKVFDELPLDDISSWNSMINAFVESGLYGKALGLFSLIKSKKLEADEVTMLGLISACRGSGKLSNCVDVHSYIENSNSFNHSIVLHNALIDMYAKCGCMKQAKIIFDKMPKRDVISWTSVIVGYAINGEGREALDIFHKMVAENVEPNSVTYIGVLLACDHAGLVSEGQELYETMCRVYNIKPIIEHCGCMVDMLARAGMLEEAHRFVKTMPVEPNSTIWRMLINGCRVHGNTKLGLILASELSEVKKLKNAEDHVLASNMFAESGMWDDVLNERSFMKSHNASKEAGLSSVSV